MFGHLKDAIKALQGGASRAKPDRVEVAEFSTNGARGGYSSMEADDTMTALWCLPADIYREVTTAPSDLVGFIRVVGTSMEPEYRSGDRLMVDATANAPVPSGEYLVDYGTGLEVKICELLPGTEPPQMEMRSYNPSFPSRVVEYRDGMIKGRIAAHWRRR